MGEARDAKGSQADEAAVAAALVAELGLTSADHDLIAGMLRIGVTPEAIRESAAKGRVEDAVFDSILDPEREKRTISANEIASDGGLPVAEIEATLRGFGLALPGPDEDYFTAEEARAFRDLGPAGEFWPSDVRIQLARVYGQALERVARTELHLFRSRVERFLRDANPSTHDALAAVRQAFEFLLPLADPFLLGVHRRKIEQAMTQAAVREVEREAGGQVPGTVEVSLVFCDLRGFTSYSNRVGDGAAIEVLDRFARAVDENIGESGRLVKALGDGYMLAYPDPGPAVSGTLAIAAAMHDDEVPKLHAGLHHGQAVFRDGDYYGRSVNLAARLLGSAETSQLMATEVAARETAELPWRRQGVHALRGFSTPLELFSLDLE